MAGHCSWTSLALCRCPRRTGCCARSNMARSPASAPPSRSESTSASSPRPTKTCRAGSSRASSEPTCSTACRSRLSPCRRCARARGTSGCLRSISDGVWASSSNGATGPASPRGRWPRSKPILGPAMSASCAMSSSARSIATRTPSGRSMKSCSIPFSRPLRRSRSRGTCHCPKRAARSRPSTPPSRCRFLPRPTTCAAQSQPMSGGCSRMRSAVIATINVRPQPRLDSATTSCATR